MSGNDCDVLLTESDVGQGGLLYAKNKDFESCRMLKPPSVQSVFQTVLWGKISQGIASVYINIFVDPILVNFSSISKCLGVYATYKEQI